MNALQLPVRTTKPRIDGVTAITDLGLTFQSLHDLLCELHPFIDFAKFGIGSAYLTARFDEKIALYQEFGVAPYCGGTLFEKFYQQENLRGYLTYLKQHNMQWIEISNGTIDTPLDRRVSIVKELSSDFKVVAEVGRKNIKTAMTPGQWIEELQALLHAGASYVVTEGRDSATAGIYQHSGEPREELVRQIVNNIDVTRTIFEAPTGKSQMYFINLLGPNVNLGNVAAKDLLLLESQRCGLRHETFFVEGP